MASLFGMFDTIMGDSATQHQAISAEILEAKRQRALDREWYRLDPDRTFYFRFVDCFMLIAQTVARGQAPRILCYGEMVAMLLVFQHMREDFENLEETYEEAYTSLPVDPSRDKAGGLDMLEILVLGGCMRVGWLGASRTTIRPLDPAQWFLRSADLAEYSKPLAEVFAPSSMSSSSSSSSSSSGAAYR
jgi:hypothetical protein